MMSSKKTSKDSGRRQNHRRKRKHNHAVPKPPTSPAPKQAPSSPPQSKRHPTKVASSLTTTIPTLAVSAPIKPQPIKAVTPTTNNPVFSQAMYIDASTQTDAPQFTSAIAPIAQSHKPATQTLLIPFEPTKAVTSNPDSVSDAESSPITLSFSDDDGISTDELQGWESGIKQAASVGQREAFKAMLRDEIRERGLVGKGQEVVESVLASYARCT